MVYLQNESEIQHLVKPKHQGMSQLNTKPAQQPTIEYISLNEG